MPSAKGMAGVAAAHGVALWRILLWVILLLAAFGCVQYLRHADQVWTQLQALLPGDTDTAAAMQRILAWDIGYLLAALAWAVLCVGGILRHAWARTPLRVAAVLLAVWAVFTGVLMALQWHDFAHSSSIALAQPQADPALRELLAHANRRYAMALSFKVLSIVALLWLVWKLGRAEVKAQFRARAPR
jgi:hypothetical protein